MQDDDQATIFVRAVLVALAVFWVSVGCSGERRVDYHLMEPRVDATEPASSACLNGETEAFVYRFPAGNEAKLTASVEPAFSVELGGDAGVRLTKVPPLGREGIEVVVAEVTGPGQGFRDAEEHRRHFQACDLLVVVGGQPVGVAYGGTGNWEGFLPAGAFDSYESAEAVYAGAAGRMERTVPAEHFDGPFQHWASFPHGAHNVSHGYGPPDGEYRPACGASLALAFIRDPKGDLDLSCIDETLPPDFEGRTWAPTLMGTEDFFENVPASSRSRLSSQQLAELQRVRDRLRDLRVQWQGG